MEKDVIVRKKEYAKKYREMNKEKEKERRNRWMAAHPEKRKEYAENLKKNNPEACRKMEESRKIRAKLPLNMERIRAYNKQRTKNKQIQKVVDCLGNM